jgi:hypothetical protein
MFGRVGDRGSGKMKAALHKTESLLPLCRDRNRKRSGRGITAVITRGHRVMIAEWADMPSAGGKP